MKRGLLTVLALTCLAGCTTINRGADPAGDAASALAASAVPPAPAYPADCRKRERSGVRLGDPLDTALIRTDQALGRANQRVARCAHWYDTVSGAAGKAGGQIGGQIGRKDGGNG